MNSLEENKNLQEAEHQRRIGFLKFPSEAGEVDYKMGVKLESKTPFTFKLIRHIIAMANSGGGFLVIGYKEDGQTKIPTAEKISDEILNSYDVSILAEMVEGYISGTEKIELKVYKEINPDNGATYPIIEIIGFKKRPFFCGKDASIPSTDPKKSELILKQSSLYVRNVSARTGILATPDQWDALIDKCVESHQDELMKRFRSMLKSVGFSASDDSQKKTDRNVSMTKAVEQEVSGYFSKKKEERSGLEITHSLVDSENKWDKAKLVDAMEKSQQKNTGWPIGTMYRYNKEGMPIPLADGIRLKIESGFDGTYDFWQLNDDGTFYFFRKFQEDLTEQGRSERILWFDTRVWRVVEGIKHMVDLYKNLGVDPSQMVSIEIKHCGINERALSAGDHGRAFTMYPRKSGPTKDVAWKKEATLDEFLVNSEEYAKEALVELFTMFEFWQPAPGVIDGVINDYNSSEIRH
jgi:hypothetical protein